MISMKDLIVDTSILPAPHIASPLFFGDILNFIMSAEVSLIILYLVKYSCLDVVMANPNETILLSIS